MKNTFGLRIVPPAAWRIMACFLILTATQAVSAETPASRSVPVLSELTPEERQLIRRIFPSEARDLWVTLENGMTVFIREMPLAPVASCQVFIKAGSILEADHLTGGLTHYLEHIVSGGATTRRTEEENKALLRQLGGATNAYTSYDRTVYYIDTAPEHAATAMELLLSYALDSKLDPKEVEREKKVIEREILMTENDPDRKVWRLFSETAFQQHPVRYPVIGYLDRFLQVTREDLLNYYHQRYVPSNMIVTVVGNIQGIRILQQVLAIAGGRPGPTSPLVCIPDEPRQLSARWAEIESPLVRVSRAQVGFQGVRMDHPDLYALDVLAMILGQGRSSRLYQALKEQKELVLSVSSGNWTPTFVRGLLIVSMSMPEAHILPALDVMWEEIRRLQREGPTEEELARAKKKIQADHVYDQQSSAGLARSISSNLYATGDAYFEDHYTDRMQSVTAEEVLAAAQRYLDPAAVTVAVLRPQGTGAASPEATAKTDATAHPVQKFTLSNGLRVLVQSDKTLPMTALRLYGVGGAQHDPPGRPGLGRFAAGLLTKGAGPYDSAQLARMVEDMGATLVSGSGHNSYFIQAQCLSSDLERLLELMAEVLLNPTFPDSEIEKVRKDTLLAIQKRDEHWISELNRLFRESQFQQHPFRYDLLGSEESVSGITRSMIREFHGSLLRSNHMVLAAFGDVDAGALIPLLETLFGNLKPGPPPTLPPYPEEFSLASDRSVKAENEKSAAGILMVHKGLHLRDPRKPLLDVIDALISGVGYPGGWLFESLRGKDRSLVYVVHGFPRYYHQGGFYKVVAQCAPEDVEQVKSIIREQLARLAHGDFTPEELRTAKDVCITYHRISLDSLTARADSAALDELNGLGYRYAQEYPELVEMVTPEAVTALSRQLFASTFLVETSPAEKEGY